MNIAHGTYAGYNAERSHGLPVCDDCRHAASLYMREWRSKSPKAKDAMARDHADVKAMRRLAHLHPAQYKALREDEYRRAGIDDRATRR